MFLMENFMKKTILLFFVICLFLFSIHTVMAEDFTFEDFTYALLPDGNVEIIRYTGNEEIIEIPAEIEDVPVTSIGKSAFSHMETITEIHLPESITYIDNYAFSECTKLHRVNIPDGILYLGDLVFQGDILLESIELPAGLVSIGMNPFDRCDSLTEIRISDQNNNYSAEEGVLFDRKNNILVSYPSGKEDEIYSVPDWVTEIGFAAFSENNHIKGITLSDEISKINGNPFCGCIGLEAILISPLNQFFEFYQGALFNSNERELIAYLWNSEIDSYTVPAGTRTIGQESFYKHPELKTVKLSQTLTAIKDAAFAESGLREITIPNNVTEISKHAFANCADLETVNLPSNLSRIGEYAFSECEAIKEISFPNSLISIGEGAFYHCTGLKELTFPESLHFIGNYAFLECTDLEIIDFPSNLFFIGGYAFYGIENLSVIVVPGSLAEEWAIIYNVHYDHKEIEYLPDDYV